MTPLNFELLSDSAKAALLARLAHTLTICARDTYEVGTENVLDCRTLRAYNELLHQVTGSVVSRLTGSDGDSLQSAIQMIRQFGLNYGRTGEMEWALQFALKSVETETADNLSEHRHS
jgi:hypothetical protein